MVKVIVAKYYILLRKPKKAKKVLHELIMKYPKSYQGHKIMAQIYENEGGMRKAIDEYVRVLDIKKNDYDSYYKISLLLNDLGKKEEAIEMLKTLLKNKPQIHEASVLLGNIYIENNELKKAIEVFSNSIKYEDNDYKVYYDLGVCYVLLNDFGLAKRCFQKTTEIDHDMYLAYFRLGQIALLYREYDVAEDNFKKSIYKEKEAEAYYELAKIHTMKNKKEETLADLRKAINTDTSYYSKVQEEPLFFSIRRLIEKPKNEVEIQYKETDKERDIDEYLNNMFNITKSLNQKK